MPVGSLLGTTGLEVAGPLSRLVTVGDEQVTVGPNGMVTFVPPGVSGLVGTFEFAAPAPSA